MRLIKPSYQILFIPKLPLIHLEEIGRVCYKSEEKITDGSADKFCRMLVDCRHLSVIEHESATVRFVCDRGVSHELVRHRLASFSQESTRYCNYKGGVTFIIPPWVHIPEGIHNIDTTLLPEELDEDQLWLLHMKQSEVFYIELIARGWSPQQARSVLPNSLKTEIVVTANLREWMHIFEQRTSKAAHPQMRELMVPLLLDFRERIPIIFDGVGDDKE